MNNLATLAVSVGVALAADLANHFGGFPYWGAVAIAAVCAVVAGAALHATVRRSR